MSGKAKRPRTSLDHHHPVVDFWRREVGSISSRSFAHRFAASENLVLRLDIHKKLQKHRGCVNTVSFNAEGGILISGSDDRRVILWNWEVGSIKLSFHSGHSNNVFQAKFMPFSDDRSIVTCAADGEVRHAKILESGKAETSLLGIHQGRAHKLAIEPGSPHVFYTCGEDGLVQHFDLRTRVATQLFTCQPIDHRSFTDAVKLNAIAIDPRNPHLFAVAGMDEYARLFDIRRYKGDGASNFGRAIDYFCPPHLIGNDQVGITGLAFSDQSELLVSYNDEFIYLFTPDMGLGPNPVQSSPTSKSSDSADMDSDQPKPESVSAEDDSEQSLPQVYKGHRNWETVKGVSFFGPRCEYVVSGSDCGRIFIWRKRGGELVRVMEADRHVVNCIEPHPHIPVLASSGIESDIKVWTPKAAERATLPKNIELVRLPSRFRIPWLTFASIHDFEEYLVYDDLFGNDTMGGIVESEDDEEESVDDAEDDDDSDDASGLDDCSEDYMDGVDDEYDDDMDDDDDDDDFESEDSSVEVEDDETFVENDKNNDSGDTGSEGNVGSVSGNDHDDHDDDVDDDDDDDDDDANDDA